MSQKTIKAVIKLLQTAYHEQHQWEAWNDWGGKADMLFLKYHEDRHEVVVAMIGRKL
jgi:hypothetical protein